MLFGFRKLQGQTHILESMIQVFASLNHSSLCPDPILFHYLFRECDYSSSQWLSRSRIQFLRPPFLACHLHGTWPIHNPMSLNLKVSLLPLNPIPDAGDRRFWVQLMET